MEKTIGKHIIFGILLCCFILVIGGLIFISIKFNSFIGLGYGILLLIIASRALEFKRD